jgi:hypothetical protein
VRGVRSPGVGRVSEAAQLPIRQAGRAWKLLGVSLDADIVGERNSR